MSDAIGPRLRGAELVVGGGESLRRMSEIAESATERLDVDLFTGTHHKTLKRLAQAGSTVDSLFLADPEVSKRVRGVVADAGNRIVDVGAEPRKNHAKSIVADGDRALVTTAAVAAETRTKLRFDVGAAFSGDAADALADLTRTSATGDSAAIRAASDRARAFGIVNNDPAHGVWNLSDEVRGLVTGAEHRLIVATKRLEEPEIRQLIKDAKHRGVAVTVAKQVGKGVPLHANIVIADDAAYIGSGHLSRRVMTGGGANGRLSRELGVILEEPKVVGQLAQALADGKFIKQKAVGAGMRLAAGAGRLGILGSATGGVLAAGLATTMIMHGAVE
ncbi:MAG: hypothetical protein JWM86_645 [Thermoleophilia bacterium]|nr:hypothetical protein [Thermoleophilia bacterium]